MILGDSDSVLRGPLTLVDVGDSAVLVFCNGPGGRMDASLTGGVFSRCSAPPGRVCAKVKSPDDTGGILPGPDVCDTFER